MEDDKKRFVRELLSYLDRQKAMARKMYITAVKEKLNPSISERHHAMENAFYEVSKYVRAITKPKKIK
jgi:hypothetical protein